MRILGGVLRFQDETDMVIDGSPPVGAVPNEFAAGFAAPLDLIRRNGFGRHARLRSCFIRGVLSYLLRLRPPKATDSSMQSFTATLRVTENFQSRAIAQAVLRLKMVGEILVWRAARTEADGVTLGPTR
jgi:hypothetical protein